MSAADDLKRLAEAYPDATDAIEFHERFHDEVACGFCDMVNIAAQLYAENRALNERIDEARGMLTFYCEDYCTCQQDPHVGSDTDGLDPPCLTVLIKEWIARLAADDAAQRKGWRALQEDCR